MEKREECKKDVIATECEQEMYACIDHTLPTEMEKREECKKDVIAKFMEFQERWSSAKPGEGKHLFVKTAQKSVVSDEQRRMIRGQCEAACGAGADSSCATECEQEMYACIDHTLPTEMEKREECKKDVIAKFKKFQERWSSAKPGEGKHLFVN